MADGAPAEVEMKPKQVGTKDVDAAQVVEMHERHEGEVPTPAAFSFFYVKWYCLIILGMFVVTLGLAVAGLLGSSGDLGGSFTDPTDIRVRRLHAFIEARDDYIDTNQYEGTQLRQTENYGELDVFFRSDKGNMFASNNLGSIQRFEDDVRGLDDYEDYCLQFGTSANNLQCYGPFTVLKYLFEDPQQATTCRCDAEFGNVPCAILNDSYFYFETGTRLETSERLPILQDLCSRSKANATSSCGQLLFDQREHLVGKNFDCETGEARYVRSSFSWGLPLKGYRNSDEDYEEQDEEIEDWHRFHVAYELFAAKRAVESRNGDVTVYFKGDGFPIVFYFLDQDLLFLALSLALVAIIMWQQTGSAFITVGGVYQIGISFPIALFFWYIILGEPYVTYLMYCGVFVTLGIGADDVFVYFDAWLQSSAQRPEIRDDLATRFIWTYRRAATAMFATTATTMIAFIACAASPVWDIRCFGVVNGFTVLSNYLLVISWFPAWVLLWELKVKDSCAWADYLLVSEWIRIAQGKSKEPPRDEPPPRAQPRTMDAVEREVRDHEGEGKGEAGEGKGAEEDPPTPPAEARPAPRDHTGTAAGTVGEASKLRPAERFFAITYFKWLAQLRYVVIAVFAALIITTTVTWVLLLKPATESTEEFADGHFVSVTNDISDKKFGLSANDDKIATYVVFGIRRSDPIDKSNVHPADPFSFGRPRYQKDFSFFDLQTALSPEDSSEVGYCQYIFDRVQPKGRIPEGDGYYCAPEDFRKWSEQEGNAWPYTDESFMLRQIAEWYNATNKHGYLNLTSFDKNYQDNTGIDLEYDDGEDQPPTGTRWMFIGYNTTLDNSYDDSFTLYGKTFHQWNTATNEANDIYGASAYQTNEVYDWLVASQVFYNSAIENMSISIALSIVILTLITRNYLLVPIAALCLYTIVTLTFGVIAWAGWEINVIESICITMAAGLSVDYVVHIVHTFNEAAGTAQIRTQAALGKMGTSIVSGAMTTFAATIALLLCNLQWFSQFGTFIAIVISMAVLTALIFLPALLYAFGPNDDQAYVEVPTFAATKARVLGGNAGAAAASSKA